MNKALKSSRSTSRSSKISAGNYTNFKNTFVSARGTAQTQRDIKAASKNVSSYWSRFDDLDRVVGIDSDSDIDYDSGNEKDESMVEDNSKFNN